MPNRRPVYWQTFYLNDPTDGLTNITAHQFVLGGEVCMWGETVDTSDVIQTIFPRAAAAAERLWSPQDVNSVDEVEPRLQW